VTFRGLPRSLGQPRLDKKKRDSGDFMTLRIAAHGWIAGAALFISACASQHEGGGSGSTWHDNPYQFGESELPLQGAPESGTAKLVFLRPADRDAPRSVANVYVGERFLSSLLPGGYVVHQTCAGAVNVAAVMDDAGLRHQGREAADASVQLDAGATYYFVVRPRGGSGAAAVERVDAARANFDGLKAQRHGISRAPRRCSATPAAAEAPAAAGPLSPPASCAVSDRTAVIASASAELEPDDLVQLRCGIETWRAAWEAGDFAAYQAQYDASALGDRAQQQAWEAQRRKRLGNADKQVSVGPISLRAMGDTVVSEFIQDYRSRQFSDHGSKQLTWKKRAAGWRIVSENFSAARR
jgi:hypothetical protein